jgi:hypothetical protein
MFLSGSTSIFLAILFVMITGISGSASAAERSLGEMLPAKEIIPGWTMEEGVKLFNRENLFDHINGEAEIYLPYGFIGLASARYVDNKNARSGLVADIYRMGSRLDAFGIYSNYRRTDDAEKINTGNEGFVSASQLLFYQDRYFVRLSASGDINPDRGAFTACAQAISRNLPVSETPPAEPAFLRINGVKENTTRYFAQSLLGYSFLRRGIIADAVIGGDRMQVFVVFENSGKAAREAFDEYGNYLKASGKKVELREVGGSTALMADEPLYQKIYMMQSGSYLVGAVRFQDAVSAGMIVEKIMKKTAGEH